MSKSISSTVKRYAAMAELEKQEKGPVYVLNNLKGGLRGQLLMSIPKRNGNGSSLVKIPDTFIPIDLTAQVPRADLIDSAEFRMAASETRRHIRLLNPDYAEALLATDDAKEELRRIQNEQSAARAAIQSATLGETATVEDEIDDLDDEVDLSKIKSARNQQEGSIRSRVEKADVDFQVPARVKGIVSNSLDGQKDSEVINSIQRYRLRSKEELIYLASSFKDRPKVIKFLRTLRDQLKAQSA